MAASYPNRAARRRRARFQPTLQSLEPRALLSVTPTGTTIAPVENSAFSGTVATFAANDAGPFSASIDWGDGTTTGGTVASNAGSFTVSGQHTYAEDGTEPISVEIIDAADATTATALGTASIQENAFGLTAGAAIATTEGTALTGIQLATFNDPGSPDPASDFAATVDWGDGTTTAGAVTGSNGNFTVTGSHTYADELNGSYSVTVSEPDANFTFGPIGSSVTVAEGDTVDLLGATITPTEGHAFSGAVATFTDLGNPSQVAGDWTVSIDWGDGTTSTGMVSGPTGGPFTINGNHTYSDEGQYSIVAALSDNSPSTLTATVTSTAAVAEGDFGNLVSMTVTTTEGHVFSGAVASFTDTGNPLQVAGDWTASIDWGDNSTTAGTVSGPTGGPFTISGSHTYAEEGRFTVLATFSDDPPSALTDIPITSSAVVSESDLTVLPVTPMISSTEGVTFSGSLATISDPGSTDPASDFSANIDWGDGTTTSGTVTGSAGTYTVSGAHAYADEGAYTVTVTAAESGTSPGATATFTASVAEGDSGNLDAATITPTEGAAFSGAVGSFTDTGNPLQVAADWTASVDWGDGTTTAGTVTGPTSGPFTISGNHTYADEGTFTVLASFADDAPSALSATITSTAVVSDAPLSATGTSITLPEATLGTPLVVATFTDANPNATVSDFTATIDWGDGTTTTGGITTAPPPVTGGTTPGMAGAAGSPFYVSGGHTYAEDGTYSIKVSIADVGGSKATAASTAVITEPALTISPLGVIGHERSPLTNVPVATFTHGNDEEPASGFSAKIDWGDGTSSAGVVSLSGTTYTVGGSHTYLDEGHYTMHVAVSDDSATAAASASATIKEELLPNGTEGTPNQRFIQEVYRDLLHRGVDQAGLDYWSGLLDQGQSRFQVVSSIITAAMPGELGVGLVTGMYQKYLDRAPDAVGLAYWVGVVSSGGTIENTEAAIIGSQEFFTLAGGTNAGFIQRLFQVSLDRNPVPDDITYYNGLLASGQSRQQVAGDVLNSPEYYSREVAGYYQSPNDANGSSTTAVPFIDDLDFLDRPADSGGLATFTTALEHGISDQQIWAQMMASDEYFAKIA